MFRFLVILFLMTTCLFANQTADKIWADANRYYEQAEEQIRKSGHGEAAVLFKASLDMLKRLQYDHPTWNSSVVKNRLAACQKRIADAEKLILQSIQNLSIGDLQEELKTTLIAKAKFSKAMMILYDDLTRAKQELKIKNKALTQAREAAGIRVTDKAHLDKLTFENLKLRKSLRDKEAQILTLSTDDGSVKKEADSEILKYKQLQKEFIEKEQTLKTDKVKLASQLKEISLQLAALKEKEKSFEATLEKSETQIEAWQKRAADQKRIADRANVSVKDLNDKLTLALNRVKGAKEREAEMVNTVAALKKNGGSSKMIANLTERNDELLKKNNQLEKANIDLSTKVRNIANDLGKAQQTLKEQIEGTASSSQENTKLKSQSKQLEQTVASLKKQFQNEQREKLSFENENKSLQSQIKILQKINEDYKTQAKKEVTPAAGLSGADGKLLKAYEKQVKENEGKLSFLEAKIRNLAKENAALKEENIAGDEQIIAKYVEAREELKVYKARARKMYEQLKTFEGGVDTVIEAAMSKDEEAENSRLRKINDLLFRASKQQDSEVAIGLYANVLKLDNKNFDALLRIGFLSYEQRHFHDAVIHLQKAFYQQPDHPQLLLALGVSLIELDKLELAMSAFSRLVGKYPKDSQAHLQLGIVLQGLGWIEAAINHFSKAFEIDPQSGDAAFNLAVSYLALQEPNVAEAKIYYNKAMSLGIVKDPVLEKYFSEE